MSFIPKGISCSLLLLFLCNSVYPCLLGVWLTFLVVSEHVESMQILRYETNQGDLNKVEI